MHELDRIDMSEEDMNQIFINTINNSIMFGKEIFEGQRFGILRRMLQ